MAYATALPPTTPIGDQWADVVYFAHDPESGLTKIGTTSLGNVTVRIRDHERATGHILTILGAMPGGRDTEREIHQQLKPSRQRREWFFPSDELAEIVLALPIPSTAIAITVGVNGLQS